MNANQTASALRVCREGLSLLDTLKATILKSQQQKICERYASANPDHYEISIRRWDGWIGYYGCPYHAEIWNLTKYTGNHVHTADDIAFGIGITIADAFSDLLRNIIAYERISEKTAFRNNVRILLERIREWELDERK